MKRFFSLFLVLVLITCSVSKVDAQGGIVVPQFISIDDDNLDAIVRDILDLRPGAQLLASDMETFTHLNAPQSEISDLDGLQYATNLRELYLWGNDISGVHDLTNLTQLERLHIGNNNISSVWPLRLLQFSCRLMADRWLLISLFH